MAENETIEETNEMDFSNVHAEISQMSPTG